MQEKALTPEDGYRAYGPLEPPNYKWWPFCTLKWRGCGEEPSASTSQLDKAEAVGNERQILITAFFEAAADLKKIMSGQQKGNKYDPRPFNFSPEFFSLLRQTMRGEIDNFYNQGSLRSDNALSSPPSFPTPQA